MHRFARKVKAVFFDFGGTLDSDGLAWKEQFYPIYRRAGVHWPFKKFERCFYASDDDLSAGALKGAGYRRTLLRQVSGVLRAGGAFRRPLAERIVRDYLRESGPHIARNKVLLGELGRRYKLGVISNFYGNLPRLCRDAGLHRYFGAVIDSGIVGCKKPDPDIFFRALDALKAKAGQSVFVGDSFTRDILGAEAVGMKPVWLVHPGRGAVLPRLAGCPVIRSPEDLRGLLL